MKTKHIKKGFTLVETLVAVAILAIAVTGPFFTAEQSIQASKIAQDKMVGSFLAQEGVEFMRVERDNSYLKYCYGGSRTACSPETSAYWWTGFTTNNQYGGTYNVLRCSESSPCSIDANALSSGVGFGTGSIAMCGTNSTTCGTLYITSNGKYTTSSAGNVKTIFKRTVFATQISNTEIKTTSKVSWVTHGKTYTATATDNLTPWY